MALGTTDKLLKFRVGNFTNLKNAEFAAGTVYVTQDEKALYIDLPTGTNKENGRIRLGGMVQYETLADWNAVVPANPPYSTEAIYYIVDDNALIKWNGQKWVQINSTATVTENLDALTNRVIALETAKTEQATKITNLETAVNTTIPDTYATKEALKDATVDIGKIVGQIGDSTNGLVKDIADNKKAIEDEVTARTNAISGVNQTIEGLSNKLTTEYSTTALNDAKYQTIVLAATKEELNTAKAGLLGNAETDTATTKTIEGAFKAVAAEADARTQAINGVNTTINGIKDDYLTKALAESTYAKAADVATDAELNEAKAELLGTSGVDGNTIHGALKAVSDEASRASGVESGLNTRLGKVEAFFELAEGEQLDEALDTLKEIQTYITSEGAAADKMVVDIATNKASIEALEGIVGTTAEAGLRKAVADNAAAIAKETANRNAALSWGTF